MFDMFTMLNLLGPSVTDVFEIIARGTWSLVNLENLFAVELIGPQNHLVSRRIDENLTRIDKISFELHQIYQETIFSLS